MKTGRVLVAKLGLDLHDRGIKIIARALRDSGIEVIYLGARVTKEELVETAIQEDVDMIALGFHSGGHNVLLPKVLKLLKDKGRENIHVVVGGIIPQQDHKGLNAMGISGIFGPGTPIEEIVGHCNSLVAGSKHS